MNKSLDTFRENFTRSSGRTVTVPRRAIAAVCVVWAVIVLYVAQEQLPKNAITLPAQKEARHTVINMAPQGWAFFTKSPRDVEVVPYGNRSGRWQPLSMTPHSSPKNAFGLDRASRAQGVEIAMVLSAAKKADWHPCERDRESCLTKFGTPARTIKNTSPEPSLCGTVGLLQERPTPWAWRDLVDDTHTPERVMVLRVTC
ncbi:SdpA family antimicrobial peptide system protein [Streptomyces laurentii]|uniref:SdpA family antimicrobial peptide system protein n=1 Tax=Streptomyces laurentii TaxID=39478 RepID=UPI0036B3B8D4